jgi:hypothetical protein
LSGNPVRRETMAHRRAETLYKEMKWEEEEEVEED